MTHLRKQIKNIDEVYKQVGEIAIHNHLHSYVKLNKMETENPMFAEEKTLTLLNTDPVMDPWLHVFVYQLYAFFNMNGFMVNSHGAIRDANILFRLPTEPNAYGSFYDANKFMSKVKKFIEPEVIDEAESLIRRQMQRKLENDFIEMYDRDHPRQE